MASRKHDVGVQITALMAVGLQIGMLAACPAYAAEPQSQPLPAAVSGPASASAEPHPYAPHVTNASRRFGIPERWIWSVMRAESGGRSRAVSPVGAMGLMQIMPRTWKMLAARYGLGSNPFDARANIHGGAAYLRLMWDRYGDSRLMLAAYNAGPGRVDEYRAGLRHLPAETRSYVARLAPFLIGAPAIPEPQFGIGEARPLHPPSVFVVAQSASEGGLGPTRGQQPDEAEAGISGSFGSQPGAETNSLFVPLSPRLPR
jgi:hypothetical protein